MNIENAVFAMLWAVTMMCWMYSAVRWNRNNSLRDIIDAKREDGNKAVEADLRARLRAAEDEIDEMKSRIAKLQLANARLTDAMLRWVPAKVVTEALGAYEPPGSTERL